MRENRSLTWGKGMLCLVGFMGALLTGVYFVGVYQENQRAQEARRAAKERAFELYDRNNDGALVFDEQRALAEAADALDRVYTPIELDIRVTQLTTRQYERAISALEATAQEAPHQ